MSKLLKNSKLIPHRSLSAVRLCLGMGERIQRAYKTQNDKIHRKSRRNTNYFRDCYERVQLKAESSYPLPFMPLFKDLQEKTGLLQMF